MNTTLKDRIIDRLLGSPLARQAAADEERERLAHRRQLLTEITQTRASLTPRLQKLKADERAAESRLHDARRLVRECESEVAAIASTAMGTSSVLDHAVGSRELELCRTAHPGLAEFIADAHARANAARNHVEVARARHVTDILGRTREIAGESNTASVVRVRAALFAAIAEAEVLQLSATPDSEIEARLAALREELHLAPMPAPMPGQPVVWRDETAITFADIAPPMVTPGPLLTPAEQREVAWRTEETPR